MKTTKTKKWWFCFTLAAAMIIATIITDMLYIEGGYKILLFGSFSLLVGLSMSLWKMRVCFIVSLLIFCSSSFILMAPANEFIVFCRSGQIPVALEYNFKLALPYTYDAVIFNRYQELVVIEDNYKAVVGFELSKDAVLMIQHGFADQKDFAAEIQKRADPRFFQMNGLDRKEYLDSFNIYGLQWKKIIIETYIGSK
ncbi:MAG: hypothetical protein US76_03495 [Parcubacteria group bacterium GW2011_GWA2_38_13b]|nr:MAG: hypothetical protein US76_03495 [Parcubacteria group bacterium GW2011_GWA2_38_13b]